MGASARKINQFLMIKLPSAFLCGVRMRYIDGHRAITSVRHSWINQNPFNSMYFAVQAMAAELSTGALVLSHIRESDRKFSMLVAANRCHFMKKATGRVTFSCSDGDLILKAVQDAILTGEGQLCTMKSTGCNAQNEVVSVMEFDWTLKLK